MDNLAWSKGTSVGVDGLGAAAGLDLDVEGWVKSLSERQTPTRTSTKQEGGNNNNIKQRPAPSNDDNHNDRRARGPPGDIFDEAAEEEDKPEAQPAQVDGEYDGMPWAFVGEKRILDGGHARAVVLSETAPNIMEVDFAQKGAEQAKLAATRGLLQNNRDDDDDHHDIAKPQQQATDHDVSALEEEDEGDKNDSDRKMLQNMLVAMTTKYHFFKRFSGNIDNEEAATQHETKKLDDGEEVVVMKLDESLRNSNLFRVLALEGFDAFNRPDIHRMIGNALENELGEKGTAIYICTSSEEAPLLVFVESLESLPENTWHTTAYLQRDTLEGIIHVSISTRITPQLQLLSEVLPVSYREATTAFSEDLFRFAHLSNVLTSWDAFPRYGDRDTTPLVSVRDPAHPDTFRLVVFVSHPWECPGNADKSGALFEKLRQRFDYWRRLEVVVPSLRLEFTDDGKMRLVETFTMPKYLMEKDQLLWLDWTCLPQAPRTDEETATFKKSLRNMHQLITAQNVMVMPLYGEQGNFLEKYWTRAWCRAECFLGLINGRLFAVASDLHGFMSRFARDLEATALEATNPEQVVDVFF